MGLDDYYQQDDPVITDTIKAILTQYSNIPEPELISHIRAIRDKAFEVYKYPCIGSYNFLDFSIADSPIYGDLVERVKKNGATFLDLGVCFGQDIRKLVFDGCPSGNLVGTELQPAFINFGYELFRDREKLKTPFKTGDYFASKTAHDLPEQSFDFIHSGAFFHLFTWEEQVEAISRAVQLLKHKPGSVIFGRQAAKDVPGEFPEMTARSGPMYMHNAESFRKLLHEVSTNTGAKFDIDIDVREKWGQKLTGDWKVLSFIMRYVD